LSQQTRIIEGAEGYTLGTGPPAALFVHGFTSSPQNMRLMGDYLAERGIRVEAPLLPGHGTTWQDLNACNDTMWVQAVEESFAKLAAEFDEIFLVSLSFGSALALDFAARNPGKTKGIVSIAGMVESRDPRRFLSPVIKRLVKSLPGVGNDIADPEQREIVYDRLPTSAADCVLRMIKKTRSGLGSVTDPVLVMHSHNDHTVLPFNAELIHDNVASKDKELVWLDRSYHVLTIDVDREEVFRRTFEFIKERSSHAL
jgi:carboxylesterase